MGSFRELTAWQLAMDLVDYAYETARLLPKSELFLEGRGRFTAADQRHFYRQANASTHEIETQAEVAFRQGFITIERRDEFVRRAQEAGRKINNLIRTLPGA